MEQHKLKKILAKLNTDNIDPLKALTSAEFEDFCEALALRWAKETIRGPFETERRIAEPIDILIRVPITQAPSLPKAIPIAGRQGNHFLCHLIECKLYGRPLTLNVVGASYLHALKERPESLVIASNQQLTRGARDFSYWLFHEEMRGVTALYTWNPLPKNISSEPSTQQLKEGLPITHRPGFELYDWQLFETGSFRDISIARHGLENKSAHIVRPNASLRFSLCLKNPVAGRRIRNVFLRFDCCKKSDVNVPLYIKGKIDKTIALEGKICPGELPRNQSFEAPSLIVNSSSGTDSFIYLDGFPKLKTDENLLFLPDLREKQTHRIFKKWTKSEEQRILVVKGEGGVGKTYLCEQIAGRLKNEFGFRTTHSPLEVQTELAFLAEIVWLTFSPEIKSTFRAPEYDFLKKLLEQLSSSFNMSLPMKNAGSLADLMLFGKWDGADPEIVMQLVAQFIVASNKPILLAVSNAHRMSDSVASGLRSLLVSLEGMGWGQVRIIVEARDTQEDIGNAWHHMERWMNRALSSRIERVSLKPLDNTAIKNEIGSMLVSLDAKIAVELICKKSGGNPLFIKHLLYALIERNILTPAWNNRSGKYDYHLTRIAPLRNYVNTLSVKIEDILIHRIDFWDKRLRNAKEDWAGYLLGLMSILGQEISLDILISLIGEPSQKLEALLNKFEKVGLLERLDDDFFIFPHEYASLAARLWLETQTDGRLWIEKAAINQIDLNDPKAYYLAFNKGLLNAYLRLTEKALKAFNAALQFAGESFEALFQCHQQIHKILQKARTTETARSFHENVRSYLNHGYYILTIQQNKNINEQALAEAQALSSDVLHRQERICLMQQYHHNLSNLALRELDLKSYLKHANATLDLSTTPLDVTKFLNRAFKACSYVGAVGLGAHLGAVCLSLQKMVSVNDDPDLMSVNFAELSFLIATTDPENALQFAENACNEASSERQKAHNLYARALAKLRLGDVTMAANDIEKMSKIIDRLALRTLRSPLEMAYGIKALIDEAWILAADSFRTSLSEATWLGSFREEISAGTNLIVAKVFEGDLDAAQNINESLLTLISNHHSRFDPPSLQCLLDKTNNWLNRNGLSRIACNSFELIPHIETQGPHFLAPFLLNAQKLNNTWPTKFVSPDQFALNRKRSAIKVTDMKGVIKIFPKPDFPDLYVMC